MDITIAVKIVRVFFKELLQFLLTCFQAVVCDHKHCHVSLFSPCSVNKNKCRHRYDKYCKDYPHLVVIKEILHLFKAVKLSYLVMLFLYGRLAFVDNSAFELHKLDTFLSKPAFTFLFFLTFTLTSFSFRLL